MSVKESLIALNARLNETRAQVSVLREVAVTALVELVLERDDPVAALDRIIGADQAEVTLNILTSDDQSKERLQLDKEKAQYRATLYKMAREELGRR